MSRFYLTALAKRDLQSILAHIARHRPQVAEEVIDRLQDKCELLASHPMLGQDRPEFSGQRSFSVERWVIYYRVVDDEIEVTRIMHGARNVDDLFT